MYNYSRIKQVKRILAGILIVIMVLVSIDLSPFVSVTAAAEYDTLYLIDNTFEKWVKNDNSEIKAIDNSNGHTEYWMTQKDEITWSVKIPKNAYNITFNRYAGDKTTQWNSWSAGGRDKNNTYYVDGSEYGHWGILEESEECFHAGDVIYLDVSEFTQWENDDALMYVNFSDASKDENDILISGADKKMYNPIKVENRLEEGVYQYIVTQEDEGASRLRFWRGNNTSLWNCSVVLSYEDYLKGLNCVKVTGWNNIGITRKMTPELNCDEDYLIVHSAISELEVGYKDNDTRYSVTDNLSLVTELNGAIIEWSSSNADVISDEGIVNRPDDESANVILTANVKRNSYFETKQFEVYVIKNKYVNYNTDYIEDIDSFEKLYLYNGGDTDNLEVYTNDEGDIEYIIGSFSDIIVESPEEAILSLYNIKSLMGCKSPEEELRWVSTNKDNYGKAFRFEQVYKGIPVYGMSIVVSTDQSGYISSLQSSFVKDINIITTPELSESETKQKVTEYGYKDAEVEKLYIYMDNSVPKLAWNVYAKDSDGVQYNILIDAADGEVLLENLNSLNEFGSTKGTGTSILGSKEEFSVAYRTVGAGTYEFTEFKLRDSARNIEVYDFEDSEDSSLDSDKVIVKPSNTWEPDEVSAMANVSKAYDFYLNNFGRKGFDDKNSKIPVIIHDEGMFSNSMYMPNNDALNFGSGGSYTFCGAAALDTVGHEFTHGVINYMSPLSLYYFNATGAIEEGYADIFGCFIEGDDDDEWLYREDNTMYARALRNLSNPSEFRQPSVIGGEYYYDFTKDIFPSKKNDFGGVHINNTIVSHACYLMWKNGIRNKTRLAELWYHSLLKGYGIFSKFYSVRRNVLAAAKDMRMSAEEINIIKAAFDEVGIEGKRKEDIEGTNILTGKVVKADTDMVIGNNQPVGDALVTIARADENVYVRTPIYTVTSSDGTFYFNNIVPGTYKLTISKDGYHTTTQIISLTSTKLNNYCSTIELIPISYSGKGQAKGSIVDSLTGEGVEGLNLKIRKGLNTKTGTIAAEVQSQSEGLYETPELDTGLYCVEVIDNKVQENREKYYTTYFNIKILGGYVIPNQNAAVSTSLNAEQLRIVLEWGAVPSDLDSHLIGPTGNGSTFHIYYDNKKYSKGNTVIADLDLDDTTSYGPETTTIYNPIEGTYTFYVYNYFGAPALSESGASVKVYTGNMNEPQYVFNIPINQSGRYWTVFKYNSKTRKITPVNIVGDNVAG